MKFSDSAERDPEAWVYQIKARQEVEQDNRLEHVRDLNQPGELCFCKIKVKDLNLFDGFCNSEGYYLARRIE